MRRRLVKKLAVVLPRYGASLGGGAETLAREIIRALIRGDEKYNIFVDEVEVWTTCAKDHRTWANELLPGVTTEDAFGKNITIRRFPVDERDVGEFLKSEIAIANRRVLSTEEQLNWLSHSVNSRALYEHIALHGEEFEAIIFAPYLFATTFWGALIHPERSLVIPCLHDEPYAYQEVFRYLFSNVRGLLFNAVPEGELAKSIYDLPELKQKSAVVGMGFESVPELQKAESKSPFILYSGRKEQGKNLDLLIDYFSRCRSLLDSELRLVIIGSGSIDFFDELPEGVEDKGFVSEEEKEELMQEALFLCQPSVNESFSIVLMESWLRETPVLVHNDCAVTKHHVISSGGGCYFENVEEFFEIVSLMLRDPKLREQMGQAGKCYVERQYSWESVLERLYELFVRLEITEVLTKEESRAHG